MTQRKRNKTLYILNYSRFDIKGGMGYARRVRSPLWYAVDFGCLRLGFDSRCCPNFAVHKNRECNLHTNEALSSLTMREVHLQETSTARQAAVVERCSSMTPFGSPVSAASPPQSIYSEAEHLRPSFLASQLFVSVAGRWCSEPDDTKCALCGMRVRALSALAVAATRNFTKMTHTRVADIKLLVLAEVNQEVIK